MTANHSTFCIAALFALAEGMAQDRRRFAQSGVFFHISAVNQGFGGS
ncbi:hypothetical protein [Cognatishimia sp. WU-CL00825]